nr:SDR family NAD(P)-dependent oxidoreductase [Paenibacillus polymyxa]
MEQISTRKVVLITGGSRGIGAAPAKILATRGFRVAVNYVSNADLAMKLFKKFWVTVEKQLLLKQTFVSQMKWIRW